MLKVLAGDLSAIFNIDGQHGQRYLARKDAIAQSLCEQLMLHDQIIIPTNDYLTAAALIELLGEAAVIQLLEADQLRFIRLRGLFGYMQGEGKEGSLGVFEDPDKRRPQDSSIEESIYAGLSTIRPGVKESEKLAELIAINSHPMEMSQVVSAIRDNAFADLRHSPLWRDRYVGKKPSMFRLPGSNKNTVTMLGPPTDPTSKPIDALLALTLSNIELYLSNQFSCVSMSTGSPMGDCLDLKSNQGKRDHPGRHRLWSFLEVASVPNLAAVTLADKSKFADVLKLTHGRNAKVFKEWFHQNATLTDTEIKARYVDLLHEVPWAQTAPIKFIRFAITNLLDLKLPAMGKVAGTLDSLLLDKMLKGNSAKYFVEDLRTFSGKIGIKK